MTDDRTLEQRAYEDLDLIAGIADAALVAHAVGNDEQVGDALKEIRSIAEAWSDPDSDAFANSDYEPPRPGQ